VRIYLCGGITIEGTASVAVREADMPGRQARAAFAYLVLNRSTTVMRDALAEAIWPETLPNAWEGALSALASKLRALLVKARDTNQDSASLASESGGYRLILPPNSWIDLEAASDHLHSAEADVRLGRVRDAWAPANVAAVIASRPLLSGIEAPWIDRVRERLHDVRLRALDCLAQVYLANGEGPMAIAIAEEAIGLDPLRETAHRRLIGIHAELGDWAAATRGYARCRQILADELGVTPSPETDALVAQLGRSTSD
jgi:DNA-binding SARP family transcriptional activator